MADSGAISLEKRNKKVQARILECAQEYLEDTRHKRITDREHLLKSLDIVLERSLQQKAVLDHHGQETGEWRFEGGTALKAIELAGRTLGLFPTQSQHLTADAGLLTGLTLEEAQAKIMGGFAQLTQISAGNVIDITDAKSGRDCSDTGSGEEIPVSDLPAVS